MIHWKDTSDLILRYVQKKVLDQVRSLSFICLYLFLFQIFILRIPITDGIEILLGLVAIVFGLAFFIEGLILGIMPIGENLGVKLPSKISLIWILLFSFILGMGATFAEPAIGILRSMGNSILPEEAPFLHLILNFYPRELILCVGVGVGLAVLLGMLRFLYNWSLKTLLIPIVLLCLGLSSYSFFDPDFGPILGLAWDCGAITTGPVTVPLVVALGLGISRVVTGHTQEGTSSGFGLVTLASLIPIVTVLSFCLYIKFLSPKKSPSHAGIHVYSQDLHSLKENSSDTITKLKKNFGLSLQAILPLCLFMIIIFRFVLKEKFIFLDEIILGIFFSLIGMGLFNLGIETGLGKLGKQVGGILPAAYSSLEISTQKKSISNFDLKTIQSRYLENGSKEDFFYLVENKKTLIVPFSIENYNSETYEYTYIPKYGPIWGQEPYNLLGIFIVLVFAFFMGYGATLPEPALNTLGNTIETLSVGTFKKSTLMHSVALGVGIGITLGIVRMIWELPLFWILGPVYILLLLFTWRSSEDFTNIAWDSAGVTTGPITVPLVLSLGIGVGSSSPVADSFGILALASAFPILTVLIMGLITKRNELKQIQLEME